MANVPNEIRTRGGQNKITAPIKLFGTIFIKAGSYAMPTIIEHSPAGTKYLRHCFAERVLTWSFEDGLELLNSLIMFLPANNISIGIIEKSIGIGILRCGIM
jgi:hypothetical protein